MHEIMQLTESKQKIHILWDVTPCQRVSTSWCCGGAYGFHLQSSLKNIRRMELWWWMGISK